MSYSTIRVEQRGRVTIITIDRQPQRNALDKQAQDELQHAFDDFAADEGQWIAILTGAGDIFSAGHDLRTPAPEGPEGLPKNGFGGITARFDLDKPVIAAVNGPAVGGGFEMVLACDIVVAAARASFALPEVKVGLTALAGGILRLPRLIGQQRALGMMLTGKRVSAEEGHSLGFVTEVAPDGAALEVALRWADELLAAAPLAVRATKRVALEYANEPLAEVMNPQWDLPQVRAAQTSHDAIEGPRAFVERRAPVWTGS